MKQSFLIPFLIFTLSSIARSQDRSLVLQKNNSNQPTMILNEGKRIRVSTTSGVSHKGILSIKSDSTIIIDKEEINIRDIDKIKLYDNHRTIAGWIFVGVGVGTTAVGGYYFSQSQGVWEHFHSISSIVVSAIPASLGTMLLIANREFDTRNTWKISIQ